MKARIVIALVLVLGCVTLPTAAMPAAPAAPLIVNTLDDDWDGSCSDGDCCLRDAIQVANPGDTIVFSVTGTIPLGDQLVIDKALTISGPAWDKIQISGQNTLRVFRVDSTGNLTITGLTIREGRSAGSNAVGGGINSLGTVTASGVVFYGNAATGNGGAINNLDTLTATSCSISTNTAAGNGGGINNEGVMVVRRSTLAWNTAAYGGGFKNEGGIATMENSSFYGNIANVRGSGVDSGSSSGLHVTNSTFYGNGNSTHTATVFGNPSSTTTAVNTIIAGNYGNNCSGAFQAASNHNLSSDATCSPEFTQVSAASLRLLWQGWAIILQPGNPCAPALSSMK